MALANEFCWDVNTATWRTLAIISLGLYRFLIIEFLSSRDQNPYCAADNFLGEDHQLIRKANGRNFAIESFTEAPKFSTGPSSEANSRFSLETLFKNPTKEHKLLFVLGSLWYFKIGTSVPNYLKTSRPSPLFGGKAFHIQKP